MAKKKKEITNFRPTLPLSMKEFIEEYTKYYKLPGFESPHNVSSFILNLLQSWAQNVLKEHPDFAEYMAKIKKE